MGVDAFGRWRTWSGTYSVTPARVVRPRTADETAAAVRRAAEENLSVKAAGSGHSFTDIGLTRGVLIVLDRMTGILDADPSTGQVTVAAGTVLRDLNVALWKLGLSLTNLGDIDTQTISGAIATGTHGTGRRYGNLSTQVRVLQIVTADGEVLTCSPTEHPELFSAARISLGALGVVTAVTLQCEPAFVLSTALDLVDYDDLHEVLPTVELADHFSFSWYPHTRRVLTRMSTRLPADTALRPGRRLTGRGAGQLVSTSVFRGLHQLTSLRPQSTPRTNEYAARSQPARRYTDRSYEVFTAPRPGAFRHGVYRRMEYAVPRRSLALVVDEIDKWLQRSGELVGFPVDVRLAAGDTIPLSTAYGRDTCYVAVHQHSQRAYERYFLAVEAIAREVGGRPHWASCTTARPMTSPRSIHDSRSFSTFATRWIPSAGSEMTTFAGCWAVST